MLPSSFFSTSFDKTFSFFSDSFSLINFFSGAVVAVATTWLLGNLLAAGAAEAAGAARAAGVFVSGKMIPFKFFRTSAGKLTIRYCSLSFLLLSESLSSLSSLSDLSPARRVENVPDRGDSEKCTFSEETLHRRLLRLLAASPLEGLMDRSQVLSGEFDHLLSSGGLVLCSTACLFIIRVKLGAIFLILFCQNLTSPSLCLCSEISGDTWRGDTCTSFG